MTYTETDKDPYTKEIIITFTVGKKDFIYKDFITCSIDDPTILLSPWKTDKQSIAHYDSSFKEAKQVFNEDFSISITATAQKKINHLVHLYCSYYRRSDKKINHTLFPLLFNTQEPTIQKTIETTAEITDHHTTTIRPTKKNSPFSYYLRTIYYVIHCVVTSLYTDHKKYFALLIFCIMVLISFFYVFRKELEMHIILKEWIEIIISLLISISTAYILMYFYRLTTPLSTMLIACTCSLYAGIFYIKKSTKVQSKNLRTLCNFLGIVFISGTLLLSFKVLQYADQQFNLC